VTKRWRIISRIREMDTVDRFIFFGLVFGLTFGVLSALFIID
jgi:hypothetical protein